MKIASKKETLGYRIKDAQDYALGTAAHGWGKLKTCNERLDPRTHFTGQKTQRRYDASKPCIDLQTQCNIHQNLGTFFFLAEIEKLTLKFMENAHI